MFSSIFEYGGSISRKSKNAFQSNCDKTVHQFNQTIKATQTPFQSTAKDYREATWMEFIVECRGWTKKHEEAQRFTELGLKTPKTNTMFGRGMSKK